MGCLGGTTWILHLICAQTSKEGTPPRTCHSKIKSTLRSTDETPHHATVIIRIPNLVNYLNDLICSNN